MTAKHILFQAKARTKPSSKSYRTHSKLAKNPFDLHNNAPKQKHTILNRPNKGTLRNVALARSKAYEKRRNTLSKQFKTRNKANEFSDQRIGELNSNMNFEEKMMARFQAERKRKLRHANAYTLESTDDENENDDQFLTHRGNPIASEKFSEPDSDSDDPTQKTLENDIAKKYHFGGGNSTTEGNDPPRSHGEIMKEVMVKSKLYKAERQENKRVQEDVTEALDDTFSSIRSLLDFRPTRKDNISVERNDDDYDQLTRELALDAKVMATERKLTLEEIAERERMYLEEMEKERVKRMKEEVDESDIEDGNEESDGNERTICREKKRRKKLTTLKVSTNLDKKMEREIPYVLDCPITENAYVELWKTYQDCGNESDVQDIILERLIGYYSPKLGVENHERMCVLYTILESVFVRCAQDYEKQRENLNVITKHMVVLSSQLPDFVGTHYRERLMKFYQSTVQKRKWPKMEKILTFQFMLRIFSVTDYKHAIISPLETALGQLLFQTDVCTFTDVKAALASISIVMQIGKERERISPEILFCLKRILQFMQKATFKGLLFEHVQIDKSSLPLLTIQSQSSQKPVLAAQSFGTLLQILSELLGNYKSIVSFDMLLFPIQKEIHTLINEYHPITLPELIHLSQQFSDAIAECQRQRQSLRLQPTAIKILPSFSPKYEVNYTVRKDKHTDREKTVLKKLERQVKRARKNATRELRRDSDFIAREKQTEEETRKEAKKVHQRQIHAWLEEQNATFNQQVRKGKHLLKGGGSKTKEKVRVNT